MQQVPKQRWGRARRRQIAELREGRVLHLEGGSAGCPRAPGVPTRSPWGLAQGGPRQTAGSHATLGTAPPAPRGPDRRRSTPRASLRGRLGPALPLTARSPTAGPNGGGLTLGGSRRQRTRVGLSASRGRQSREGAPHGARRELCNWQAPQPGRRRRPAALPPPVPGPRLRPETHWPQGPVGPAPRRRRRRHLRRGQAGRESRPRRGVFAGGSRGEAGLHAPELDLRGRRRCAPGWGARAHGAA